MTRTERSNNGEKDRPTIIIAGKGEANLLNDSGSMAGIEGSFVAIVKPPESALVYKVDGDMEEILNVRCAEVSIHKNPPGGEIEILASTDDSMLNLMFIERTSIQGLPITGRRKRTARTEILRCVKTSDGSIGREAIASLLAGTTGKRVVTRSPMLMEHYGALADMPKRYILEEIDALIEEEALALRNEGRYIRPEISDSGLKKLKETKEIYIDTEEEKKEFEAYYSKLLEWRRGVAAEEKISPYIVLGSRTLRDLARKRPRSFKELGSVYGMGPIKIERYGKSILDAIE